MIEKENPRIEAMLWSPEEVLRCWVERINSGASGSGVADLYAPDAVLLPTFSPDLLGTQAQIQDYFQRLMASGGVRVVVVEESLSVKAIGESEYILAGNYVFRVDTDARNKEILARFTFVIDVSERRPIMHHHSSVINEGITNQWGQTPLISG